MYGFFLLVAAAIVLAKSLGSVKPSSPAQRKSSSRLVQAQQYALRLYKEKHFLAAEKAFLDVLKLDHRNAAAYTHLGIIYSIQHNYHEAVECFELAARYEPTAAVYQNLGLAYHENRNYMKASAAYEKAIMFEPSPARYIGLGKAFDKLKNGSKAIEALEKAVELEPSVKYLSLLVSTCQSYGATEKAKLYASQLKATGTFAVAKA